MSLEPKSTWICLVMHCTVQFVRTFAISRKFECESSAIHLSFLTIGFPVDVFCTRKTNNNLIKTAMKFFCYQFCMWQIEFKSQQVNHGNIYCA